MNVLKLQSNSTLKSEEEQLMANVGDKKNFLIRSTKKDSTPPHPEKKQQTKSVSVMAKQKKCIFRLLLSKEGNEENVPIPANQKVQYSPNHLTTRSGSRRHNGWAIKTRNVKRSSAKDR